MSNFTVTLILEAIMQVTYFSSRWVLFITVLTSILILGCATTPPANVKSSDCQIKKINWEVVPQARIDTFSCELGRHEGEDSLIFGIKLRNTGETPNRFRLAIFIPEMDKAVSYLVPTTGKPPVLAPGAEAEVKIPFMKTTQMPKKIDVIVTTVRVED
jgi:hypothetical protein